VGRFVDEFPRAPALAAGGALLATWAIALTLPRGGPSTSDPLFPAMKRLFAIPELRPLWLLSALHAATLSTYDHLFSLHVSSLGLSAKVTSAGFGCWWIGGIGLLAERAPKDLRNSAQSLFVWSAYGLGTLGAMGLSAIMLHTVDSAGLFLALSGVSAAAVVAALPLLRR
jgi:hypothetical protein